MHRGLSRTNEECSKISGTEKYNNYFKTREESSLPVSLTNERGVAFASPPFFSYRSRGLGPFHFFVLAGLPPFSHATAGTSQWKQTILHFYKLGSKTLVVCFFSVWCASSWPRCPRAVARVGYNTHPVYPAHKRKN